MSSVRTFIEQAWSVLGAFSPWLFLGLLAAGLLHIFLPEDFVPRHLGRPGLGSVVRAALLGVPLPLCSCGVIPATVGLKKDGASDGAAMAFLISTPQTGVDSIAVSAAFLGWPFALFKVIAAFVTGLLGGVLADGRHAPGRVPPAAVAPSAAASPGKRPPRWREFRRFTVDELLGGMWYWIALGILVSAALSTLFPENSLAGNPWFAGPGGMVLMLLLALPLYVCATGSVPIAAALVAAGLPPGAALVFLMAGPACNAATIGAVYRAFGTRFLATYLAVISLSSLALGFLFNHLVGDAYREGVSCHAGAAPGFWTHAWAGLLLLVLVLYLVRNLAAVWTRRLRAATPAAHRPGSTAPATLQIRVSGMTCDGCRRHVDDALRAVPGVVEVRIDLAAGLATVIGHELVAERLATAAAAAGYRATPVAPAPRTE
jgi:hypothetical protein